MDRIAVNDVSNAVIAVAILAGGDSFRMGQDKASLSDNSPALIERQVSDLRNLSDSMPIFICAGSRRYVELNVHNVRHVSDAVKSAGPLAGILQVLESVADAGLGDGYVLVVPTDSLVPPASVYRLLTDSISFSSKVVLLQAERLHPLHGLFSATLASRMRNYVESGGRSVMGFLDNQLWETVTAPPEWEPCLNFNMPEEYDRAVSAFAKMTSV